MREYFIVKNSENFSVSKICFVHSQYKWKCAFWLKVIPLAIHVKSRGLSICVHVRDRREGKGGGGGGRGGGRGERENMAEKSYELKFHIFIGIKYE